MIAGDGLEHRIMIAIVDDEDVFAEKIHEKVDGFLRNIGMDFEIRIFTDGTALLDSRSDVRFDLVFLDIDMPKITGIHWNGHPSPLCCMCHCTLSVSSCNLGITQIPPLRFFRKESGSS
ncbi:MAG: response regulator [Ruminococcus sp.]|nr:response regulator [Ruminococcus sp.]